ncbi:MAG: right-handed parallel beta-helix repeat-containing protein [Myxococcota bacterium]
MLVLGLIALSCAAPLRSVSAANYYVATNGNDANPGTSSQPFRTLQRTVAIVGPGDSVIVRGGTYAPLEVCNLHGTGSYHTSSKACPSVITFMGAPNEEVILDQQAYDGDLGCNPGRGNTPSNVWWGLSFEDLNSCLTFENLSFTNSNPVYEAERDCDIVNNYDYCVGVLNSNQIYGRYGVKLNAVDEGENRLRPSHITFRNLRIYHQMSIGIGGDASYLTLEDSQIFGNGVIGAGYGTYLQGDHMLIRNNVFDDNNGIGMRFGNTSSPKRYLTDSVIESNIVSNSFRRWRKNDDVWHGIGISLFGVYNNIVRNNIIRDSGQYGILLQGSDNLIANNTFHNNGRTLLREDIFDNYTNQSNRIYNNLGAPRSSRSGLQLNPQSISSNNRFTENPGFINVGAHDFRIVPPSGAIDAGKTLADVLTDFGGAPRPYGGAYDVGAFEYGAPTPDVPQTPPTCDSSKAGDCWSLHVEAETQNVVAPTTRRSDANASGGNFLANPTANDGQVDFAIEIPAAGEYLIWARVMASSATSDSFFVNANGASEDIFDAAEGTWSSQWQWSLVNGRDGGAPLTLSPRLFALNAGTNTLTFRSREAGTGIDVIVITNDVDFVPAGAPCGNGKLDPGEVCDDGNTEQCHGTCTNSCSAEDTCGGGIDPQQ